MSPWRWFRAILWIAIVLLALGLGAAYLGQSWFSSGQASSGLGNLGGPFTMTDHTGRRVSERDFAGRALILFFGFTRCPDACPTALVAMTELLAELGPLADRLTPVFVSIDPERDTPDVLRDYVGAFDARILGLTGSVGEVAAMAKAWRVYYRKVPTSRGEDYTMDHSTLMYVMDRYSKLRAVFNLHGGEDLAGPVAQIRQILTS